MAQGMSTIGWVRRLCQSLDLPSRAVRVTAQDPSRQVFVAQFVNTGVVLVMVHASFLGGSYSDFSQGWYAKVGTGLQITMLMLVFSPHVIGPILKCPNEGWGWGQCTGSAVSLNCPADTLSGSSFRVFWRNAMDCVRPCLLMCAGEHEDDQIAVYTPPPFELAPKVAQARLAKSVVAGPCGSRVPLTMRLSSRGSSFRASVQGWRAPATRQPAG